MAMKGDAKSLSFVEDTAVAPEKLRDYIERFLQIVREHDTSAGVYAHASVGCLHVRPVVNLKTAEGVRKFESIANDIADLVLEFGGALSGEHGDGLVRGPFTEKMFGPVLYDAFRAVKKTFDPDGLFNPGKIVDSPPLTSNLRYGAGYVTPEPRPSSTTRSTAARGAVEMCSGLGACRKKLDGTMCPSYMATREEKHSTRGRANTLRLAMAGRIGEAASAITTSTTCSICASSAAPARPSARSAWTWRDSRASSSPATGGATGRRSRRASSAAPRAVEDRCRVAPLPKPRSRGCGTMDQRTARHRSANPARLRERDVRAALRAHLAPRRLVPGTRTILFADTFTNYNHPEIGMAAVDVLEVAGVGVRLAPHRLLRTYR